MHLTYSNSKYKGKIYKSYSVAESYREGTNVRKRILWSIGKLSDLQAEQIRQICKIVKNPKQLFIRLKDVVVQESRAYLDLAVVNEVWNQWELDKAFDYDVTGGPLPTRNVAKILTINRCTDPCSHYSVPRWARRNALEEVIKSDLSGLNDDKIYYELDKIQKNKISIENHIFKQTFNKHPESYGFINYDLTTTYFIGYKCDLSSFGKGKIECHGRRQFLLGVLINSEGYPFKWDVFPGKTAEVKTLKQNINACKTRFKLKDKNVTIVFDRGIMSDDNTTLIEKAKLKYISCMDRNQIPSCGVSLIPFKDLEVDDDANCIVYPKGFKKYDNELYFHDSGVVKEKRFITGYNPTLFKEDRNCRNEKIAFFKNYLKEENRKLKNAQRDRKQDATKGRIVNELKRLKIHKYYEEPVLKPVTIARRLKTGTTKPVKSFNIEVKHKPDIVSTDELLDGVCVFITNHIEPAVQGYKVKAQSVIKAYRDKTIIEDVFKNMKSFLRIRPFFVNTDAHVKAVYTICILAYFINRYLSNKRKLAGGKDFLNSKELYAPFKDIDITTLEVKGTGETVKKAVTLPPATQMLLKEIGMSHIVLTS